MGFIVHAEVLQADGRTVLVDVSETAVTLRTPMEASDHLLVTLDDGTRRILDPPTHRGDYIVFPLAPRALTPCATCPKCARPLREVDYGNLLICDADQLAWTRQTLFGASAERYATLASPPDA